MTVSIPTRYALDVLEIGEPEANGLRIVAAELIGRDARTADVPVPGARPVMVGSDSKIFEVIWRQYVAYTVTNESYELPEGGGPREGNLQEYSSSRYLAFVKTATVAEAVHGSLRHWRLSCADHVIDVAGWTAPEIREISSPRSSRR